MAMTALELAEKLVDDIARGVRSGEWVQIRPLAVTALASVFQTLEQAGYERGEKETTIQVVGEKGEIGWWE